MDEYELRFLQDEYNFSILNQRKAFEAQSGAGDRAELASIAAKASREYNEKRHAYETAVVEFYNK